VPQAIIAAEVGYLDLAYDYLGEAALMDLRDLEHNARDGVHIASLAGALFAAVAGFGGVRDYASHLSFHPRMPEELSRLAFAVPWRGCLLRVEVTREQATYSIERGDGLEFTHWGEKLEIAAGQSLSRPLPKPPELEPVHQPAGRTPQRRRDQVQPGFESGGHRTVGPGVRAHPMQHAVRAVGALGMAGAAAVAKEVEVQLELLPRRRQRGHGVGLLLCPGALAQKPEARGDPPDVRVDRHVAQPRTRTAARTQPSCARRRGAHTGTSAPPPPARRRANPGRAGRSPRGSP
jgi:hypothetical protein